MREAQIRVATEWKKPDLLAVTQLIHDGRLSLEGLLTHTQTPEKALRSLRSCLWRPPLFEDGHGLETLMSTANEKPVQFVDRLRQEAFVEPDEVHTGEVTKETQIIAIYGKGGIGKSFTLGQPQLHDGPAGQEGAADRLRSEERHHVSLLFGGKACPTIIETSSAQKLAGEQVDIGDVCFKRDGVFAMELGGPEVGRGCGGRGIIHGFETLEKLGFHDWGFDYVLLDFLGDVVCGGFGLPIARDMCQKVIVVGSQRLAVAVRRQQRVLGGRILPQARRQCRRGRHGHQQRRRHRRSAGLRRATPAFRCWPRFPPTKTSAARAPATKSSASPAARWAPLFEQLADNVAEAPPHAPASR
jgi:chlorophyllide a reductase subunit X